MNPTGGASAAQQAIQQFEQMRQQQAQQPRPSIDLGQQSALAQAQQGFQQMGQGAGQVGQAAGQALVNPQFPAPVGGGAAGQGVNQLMQHPQVQQALQTVGSFLTRIGHPLAQQFNMLHGIGGQGVGMPQSIIQAVGQPQSPAAYQNVTNIGSLGGGVPPVSMQQLGQAAGGKKK